MEKIGIIFDWDGVIVDSSIQHQKSWEALALEEKKVLPEGHFKKGFGRKNSYIIPEVLGWSTDPKEIERLADRKEELYREYVAKEGVKVLEGAREFLTELKKANIPFGIGSSTPRANIDLIIQREQLDGLFQVIISAEDVKQGKPNPEVFLKVAERLGVTPKNSLVFEDAYVGIEAALAGGMVAVAVATTHSADSFTNSHWVVNSLKNIDIPTLERLICSRQRQNRITV